ncbi:ThuA domain-containing protein [Lacticaseibacillus hegangensis]|uniref:ThuA domain-containing protein n=1 Tax=Lacticaseibacillus hegangensis TaxID=2486010 RepID=A0ABW4CRN4_9LACO|nr:ThuA domain-containing protein [Lacticaseibacillus hegangensis]
MKKALVIRGDFYHPSDKVDPLIDKCFTSSEWKVVKTDRARDLFEDSYDLAMFFTNGRPEGETDLTNSEQSAIVKMVREGMGIMFVHAGLVLIEEDSPFYTELNSGRFAGHSKKHVSLTTAPIRNVSHPITDGVTPLTAVDEHYYINVNFSKVTALMLSASEEGTTLGSWCSEVGQGKVFSLIPGHTFAALETPQMQEIIENAILWETGLSANASRN